VKGKKGEESTAQSEHKARQEKISLLHAMSVHVKKAKTDTREKSRARFAHFFKLIL
jgi:hypothetical protein